MLKNVLLASAALLLIGGSAQAATWTGGDDQPTSPLACDATPPTAVAKPYDGGSRPMRPISKASRSRSSTCRS